LLRETFDILETTGKMFREKIDVHMVLNNLANDYVKVSKEIMSGYK